MKNHEAGLLRKVCELKSADLSLSVLLALYLILLQGFFVTVFVLRDTGFGFFFFFVFILGHLLFSVSQGCHLSAC